MIKSVKTDVEGNFLTTISIPDTQNDRYEVNL